MYQNQGVNNLPRAVVAAIAKLTAAATAAAMMELAQDSLEYGLYYWGYIVI